MQEQVSHLAGLTGRDRCRSRYHTWQEWQEEAGGSGKGEMVAGITHGMNDRKGQVQEQVSHLVGMTGRGRSRYHTWQE